MKKFIYIEFWWAIHNLIAHPLMQIVWWLSLFGLIRPVARFADRCHDWTVPEHTKEDGRG